MIKIKLSTADDELAHRIAEMRQADARRHHARRYGFGDLGNDILGMRGEIAVARWLGIPHPLAHWSEDWASDHSWDDECRRKYDVGGYQVRTASKSWYGLNLHSGDTGRFMFVLGHEAPVMQVIGWLDAEDGLRIGTWREDGEGERRHWCRVPQNSLNLIGEKITEPVSRCRILAEGREGCGCITCRRELGAIPRSPLA